jgi:hypothetical protein
MNRTGRLLSSAFYLTWEHDSILRARSGCRAQPGNHQPAVHTPFVYNHYCWSTPSLCWSPSHGEDAQPPTRSKLMAEYPLMIPSLLIWTPQICWVRDGPDGPRQKEDFDVVSQDPRADRELESQSSGPIPMSRKQWGQWGHEEPPEAHGICSKKKSLGFSCAACRSKSEESIKFQFSHRLYRIQICWIV